MDILAVVDMRHRAVRRSLLLFVVGLMAFVVAVDALLVVWLGGAAFLGQGSLTAMAWLAGIVLAAAGIQMLRLARDGRRVSAMLGGVPVATFLNGPAKAQERARQAGNILAELCIAAACPTPALYVQRGEMTLNGFACGTRPDNWCITVSEGALQRLSRDEMQALVAHELAHLTRGDTRHGLLVCACVAGLASLAFLGLVVAALAGGKSKEGAFIAVLGLGVAAIGSLGLLLATLLEAALSRQQEFRADAEAVRLTRHGDGMVALLSRLGEELAARRASHGGDWTWDAGWDRLALRPLNFDRGAKGFWFDSHPPLVDRIGVFDPAAAALMAALLDGVKDA
jgi:Zn-dependent protease with chaperone function